MKRRLGVACGLPLLVASVAPVSAAELGELARAMRLPAHSAELSGMAATWQSEALVAALTHSDDEVRQGAARVLAVSDLDAAQLLAQATASSDPTVRRLLAQALVGADLPPADLLALQQPLLVCQLLQAHPGDVLADPTVSSTLKTWLGDPAACGNANALVVARGELAQWGQPLIQAIQTGAAAKQEEVVRQAHTALCLLTHTQRGLEPYAGHYDLLVKDWQDELSAQRQAHVKAQADVLAIVSELPSETALLELLDRGAAAVPALEESMAGADRARRRELGRAARLCSRLVSRRLYEALGEEHFQGMDDPDQAKRLACLKTTAAKVKEIRDADGLRHLLTWLDDDDTVVRTAVLDRLVRLSDDESRFKGEWEIGDRDIFPADITLWRLRRSLKEGGGDEQVSALLFIGTLRASQLGEDIMPLLMSPHRAVVDTAIAALGHLNVHAHRETLARIAADQRQPAMRRVQILKLMEKSGRYSSSNSRTDNSGLMATLVPLTMDPDATVATAARKTAFRYLRTPSEREDLLNKMIAAGGASRASAFELMGEQSLSGSRPLIAMAVPYAIGEDATDARQAIDALLGKVGDEASKRTLSGLFDDEQRRVLLERSSTGDQAQGARVALCLALGFRARDELGSTIAAIADESGRKLAWRWFLKSSTGALGGIEAMLFAQQQGHALGDDYVVYQLLERVLSEAVLEQDLLERILAAGAIDVIPSDGSSSSHRSDYYKRSLDMPQGKLVLKGVEKPRESGSTYRNSNERYDWQVEQLPGEQPDRAAVLAFVAPLEQLALGEKYAKQRDLLVALLARRAPAPALVKSYGGNRDYWSLLLLQQPALRAQLVAELTGREELDYWDLKPLLTHGQEDVLPVVVRSFVTTDRQWYREEMVRYFQSLPAETVQPHLGRLAAAEGALEDRDFQQYLAALPAIPVEAALGLLVQGNLNEIGLLPYDDAAIPVLRKSLADLQPSAIIPAAATLRNLRAGGMATFDKVLAELVAKGDAASAAWLRTGIPMKAGMREAYAQALQSDEPQLWLVGAAAALKSGSLSTADFLARVAQFPTDDLGTAALVARRYLKDQLADQGPALAKVLLICPARSINAWLMLCPPDEAIGAVLVDRARDPATASILGFALDSRLRQDQAAWRPIVDPVIDVAKGRLDYLKP